MSVPILPFAVWAAGTNQNSVPANDNALRAEILAGLVISKAVTAQPGSPAQGDIYILPGTHTGPQWSTFDENDLVIYKSGTWYGFAAVPGMVVNFEGELQQFGGSGGWTVVGSSETGTAWGDLTGVPANLDDIATLVDPNADCLLFWDDSAGELKYLTLGSNLSITGTTINAAAAAQVVCIPIACGDESTPATTGAAKVTFRMPFAMTLTAVRGSLTVAPTGANFIFDINEAGSSILSTKLSIDASEKTSTTAATPAVISDANLADDAEITIDFDQVGSTVAGAGAKVYLIGTV